MKGPLDIREIAGRADAFNTRLLALKARLAPPDFAWYPYDSLGSFFQLEKVLTGHQRYLVNLIGGEEVLDVGCADGDMAFFLESLGLRVRAVDYPPTNYNHMRGVRALKAALGSSIEIGEVDVDDRFTLLGRRYGAVFFMGALYHLKNPFYALEMLARHARYCFLTTRIARFTPDRRVDLRETPVAYLLDGREANNDTTNYWIFSDGGLRRLLDRTKWEICDYRTMGNTEDSDPASSEGDERAFCFAKSRVVYQRMELLAGWHELEESAWRWTERRFSVAFVNAPSRRRSILKLRFLAPEALLTGRSLSLSASCRGVELRRAEFSDSGEYTFIVEIDAGILDGDRAVIDFDLDRALPPSKRDRRELGVVVSSLELD